MTRPFTHLPVALGYSLRYGASSPAQLVALAAEQGMTSLALTDWDGLYGAVKFAQACSSAGISPVLGVDLAVEATGLSARLPDWAVPPAPSERTPVRGGASLNPRHPRVSVLAQDAQEGGSSIRACREYYVASITLEGRTSTPRHRRCLRP